MTRTRMCFLPGHVPDGWTVLWPLDGGGHPVTQAAKVLCERVA